MGELVQPVVDKEIQNSAFITTMKSQLQEPITTSVRASIMSNLVPDILPKVEQELSTSFEPTLMDKIKPLIKQEIMKQAKDLPPRQVVQATPIVKSQPIVQYSSETRPNPGSSDNEQRINKIENKVTENTNAVNQLNSTVSSLLS